MNTLARSALVSLALAFPAGTQAAPAFNTEDCPERTGNRWCPSVLVKEGWTLKYRSQSSPELMDAYWTYEVWIRERTAMVCSHVGGRGGTRINWCQPLDEVNQ